MNDWIWLLIIGFVIIVSFLLLLRREKRLLENAQPATATVIRYDEYHKPGSPHKMYNAIVAYTLADGTPMQAKEQAGRRKKKYDIGQTLDIEYSPIRPSFFVIRGDSSRTVMYLLVLLFGVIMIGFSVAVYFQGHA